MSWRTKKIGEIADVKGGKRLPKGHSVQSEKTNHPYIRVKDFDGHDLNPNGIYYIRKESYEHISRYTISHDDIFISIAGTIGVIGKIPPHLDGANLTENAAKITNIHNIVDKDFLTYYLRSNFGQHLIQGKTTGTSQPKLALFRIRDIEVPVPELLTQQKIASILSAFDDLIGNNARRIAILKEMARLIYREWFVHYRYPGHENDRLVDSGTELGEVPEMWEVMKLKDFIKFKNGKSAKNQEGELYPIYGANGIIGRCDESKWENGVIIGRVGAYCGEVEYCEGKFWASDNTIVATTTKDYNFPMFNYYKLEDLELRRYAGGSAQPLMTQTVIKEIKTVVPSKDLLKKFQTLASKLWRFKRNLVKKNQKLKETRDLLLPRLISGKVEVVEITAN